MKKDITTKEAVLAITQDIALYILKLNILFVNKKELANGF